MGIRPGHPSLRRESATAKAWGEESGSGERTTAGGAATTEETRVRGSVARNAPRESVVCLGNKVPLFSGVQRVGPPLPPHSSPCLRGHWEGLPPE